jgi:hypothetical protein
MTNTVIMRSSGLPLCEPEQTCEVCGTAGTVGRAMRTNPRGDPTEIHRFCAPCWPEHSAALRARWEESSRLRREAWLRDPEHAAPPEGGTAFECATWHGALELVREVNRAVRATPPTSAQLRNIAEELATSAVLHVGEMPFEIKVFIDTHRPPGS